MPGHDLDVGTIPAGSMDNIMRSAMFTLAVLDSTPADLNTVTSLPYLNFIESDNHRMTWVRREETLKFQSP